MYRYFILLILTALLSPAFASRTIVTQRPYNNYYAPQAYMGGDYVPMRRLGRRHGSMFSDINDLEIYAMNRNYTRDSDLTRLERLEMQAFGTVQSGDAVTRYNNVRNAILARPKQNYKKSFFRNLSDYFGGELTGFTPSVSDNFYGQSYENSYSSPWGKGYRTNNYGFGNGSGIKIIQD
jgi:hypothetical protein